MTTANNIPSLHPRLTADELQLLRWARYETPRPVYLTRAARLLSLGLLEQCVDESRELNVVVRCTEAGELCAKPIALSTVIAIAAVIGEAREKDADEAAELARLLYHRLVLECAWEESVVIPPHIYSRMCRVAASFAELVFLP